MPRTQGSDVAGGTLALHECQYQTARQAQRAFQLYFAVKAARTAANGVQDVEQHPLVMTAAAVRDKAAFELARKRGNKVCSMEKANVMESGVLWRQVVTEVLPVAHYSAAEPYHQDYFLQHPNQGYCAFVVGPKVEKFVKTFKRLLKD